MHLQAWDPYYFSPFGVETKLRSYSMVNWGPDIFSPLLASFSFFCLKYSFRFFFVISCLSRNYSFHSHRVSLAGPNFCILFFLFLFFSFSFTLRKISFAAVQFCSCICRIAYCFVFPKFRLCSHRVNSKTTKTFKTEIRFCNFRVW